MEPDSLGFTLQDIPWEGGSVFFGAVAALAAAFAIWQTKKLWVLERRSAAYRAVVYEPVIAAVDAFVDAAEGLLNEGVEEVLSICEKDRPNSEVASRLGVLTEDFNEVFYLYKARLRRARFSWNDKEYQDEVEGELEALQDKVTRSIDLLPRRVPDPSFPTVLNDHGSSIQRLTVRHDPAIEWKD